MPDFLYLWKLYFSLSTANLCQFYAAFYPHDYAKTLHFKSDERVLGDSDFVQEVLGSASEAMERKYRLKAEGYTFDRIARIIEEIFDIPQRDLMMPGKQPYRVKARSVLICWAVQDLGMPATEVGMRLGMSQSAVSRAAQRGRNIVEELGLSPEKHRNA